MRRTPLAQPLWWASLAVLVLNDHVLKGSGLLPGWLTGKPLGVAGAGLAQNVHPLVGLRLLLGVRRAIRHRRGVLLGAGGRPRYQDGYCKHTSNQTDLHTDFP